MKLAAIEAVWHTEPGPSGLTLFGYPDTVARETRYKVEIPWPLGLIATRGLDGTVTGMSEPVLTAQERIASGVIADDAVERLKANPDDTVQRARFEAHKRDLGVAALLPFVARDDAERRMVINAIGPAWEGNQMWFILGGGAIFAACGAIDVTLSALTDAEPCVFPRAAFERVLADHQRMERLLLQRTFESLNEARGRMLVLARRSAGEKLAGFLLDMAARAGDGGCRASRDGPVTFDLPLTPGQIADVLGMTIETVSRQLTRMKQSGVIALPGGRAVTISDRAALAARAEAA